MKRSVFLWQFGLFAFATALGTLLHFTYSLSGSSLLFAPFSAVNESTFEHMKILFFPTLLFGAVQYFFFRAEHPNFWCVKALGVYLSTLLIPFLFYTLTGAFGKLPAYVNVGIFFLSAGLGCLVEGLLFKKSSAPCFLTPLCVILLLCGALLFILFTFYPPHIPLFLDPVTGGYGIR